MLLHSDALSSEPISLYSYFLMLVLSREVANIYFIVFGLSKQGIEVSQLSKVVIHVIKTVPLG